MDHLQGVNPRPVAFNRTSLESKLNTNSLVNGTVYSFNRTSLESKQEFVFVEFLNVGSPFNRTSLESKRICQSDYWDMVNF